MAAGIISCDAVEGGGGCCVIHVLRKKCNTIMRYEFNVGSFTTPPPTGFLHRMYTRETVFTHVNN
jgi:hypothetical protein